MGSYMRHRLALVLALALLAARPTAAQQFFPGPTAAAPTNGNAYDFLLGTGALGHGLTFGTLTTSTPFSISQTWNAAGVTFFGQTIAITKTAAANGSRVWSASIGGSEVAYLDGQSNPGLFHATQLESANLFLTGSAFAASEVIWPAAKITSCAGSTNLAFINNSENAGVGLDFTTANTLTARTFNCGANGHVAGASVRGIASTFASLPAGVEGMLVAVTDSTTTVVGATIAGGGANHVLAYYNGTAWVVAGNETVTGEVLVLSDLTANNVTSTKHGFAPKAPADATRFLNGAATPAYAAVKDSDLATTDITTNDVATTKHGFAPKLPNDATKYFDGTGAYAVPAIVQTTTATGTQNDFALTAGATTLRCNNASLLTIAGMTPGYEGQRLTIVSVGAGQVNLSPQAAGSTAADRLINLATVGDSEMAPGFGVATFVYDTTAARWRMVDHDQGAEIDVPWVSTNFTAPGGTFTVEVGDQLIFRSYLRGKRITVTWSIATASYATAGAYLAIKTPGNHLARAGGTSAGYGHHFYDNGFVKTGQVYVGPGAGVNLQTETAAAWTSVTNGLMTVGTISYEVQ